MSEPEQVLSFWLDEVGQNGWYNSSDALDQKIRDQFGEMWTQAMDGRYGLWLTYPSGVLAYILLLDQFPRNMFRDTGQAFASDRVALAAAKQAIARGWDLKIDEPARQFFYLPLMHSESQEDQDHCVRLMKERLPETGAGSLLHARVHREVIRQFGRFPYRNEALSRHTTEREQAYLGAGGYGLTLREFQAQAA
ncbi:DUF924 family protein [Pseudoprimorskyibacter insulae]|uniref:DUF924 domain-containing protein n=1 Tax=Pseudoprimorskyibacter insulae TaxID=1695997 RepID=A0A2R8AWT6_9RHOB|nr:DUF924 family protein [Pseudoprimorskyibacter insulae]SPF80397.1 hypothetical protein PRI8871_02203 [Pseudoprimorskyibacter insulae]